MKVIGHAVNGEYLMAPIVNNSDDVFVEPVLSCWFNKGLTVFYCHYRMDVNLGKSITHCRLLSLGIGKIQTIVYACKQGAYNYQTFFHMQRSL
jgi:hypothetical protein